MNRAQRRRGTKPQEAAAALTPTCMFPSQNSLVKHAGYMDAAVHFPAGSVAWDQNICHAFNGVVECWTP